MEDKILIISDDQMAWAEMKHGEMIHHKRKNFTKDLTSNKLVASLYEVPPGKVSWPFHYHIANEEVFYILEGEGELRTNDKLIKIKSGDFLRFPVGENGVHQLKNTSEKQPLKYLDFGTTNHPDLVFMPDSNKVGLFGGGAPCQNDKNRFIWKYFDLDTEIEFLKGE
jgi:uncharacterized cupin superfamily protein